MFIIPKRKPTPTITPSISAPPQLAATNCTFSADFPIPETFRKTESCNRWLLMSGFFQLA